LGASSLEGNESFHGRECKRCAVLLPHVSIGCLDQLSLGLVRYKYVWTKVLVTTTLSDELTFWAEYISSLWYAMLAANPSVWSPYSIARSFPWSLSRRKLTFLMLLCRSSVLGSWGLIVRMLQGFILASMCDELWGMYSINSPSVNPLLLTPDP